MKSSIRNHGKVFTALLISFVIAMPLNSCYEVIAMLNGTLTPEPGMTTWSVVLTPVYIKAIKDIFLVLTLILLIASYLKAPSKRRIFSTRPFIFLNIFSLIILLGALYSLSFMPANIVFMGIRGYWSIAFIYAGAIYWDFDERNIYPYLIAVFLLHFLTQIIQRITGAGQDVFFELRSPGMFIIPSTAGAFALLVHYFSIRFHNTPLKIISFLSLLLSNSTAGLLVFVAYYIYAYRKKMKPKELYYPIYVVTVVMFCYALISNLDAITGRGTGASTSALVRFGILYLALTNWTSLIFGMGMGIATSQAFLSGYNNAIIADNTYIGILYNAGIVPALVMLGFIFLSFRYFENKLLALTLLGYSMTTVFFEINPVVQIVLILLGSHIGRRYATASSDAGDKNLATITTGAPRRMLKPKI